jgi:hypothetical protein
VHGYSEHRYACVTTKPGHTRHAAYVRDLGESLGSPAVRRASALKTANMVQKNQTGAAPPAATVAGANGAASDLGTYIDPSQTAAGKAATGAAQAAVGTQQQAAKLGEAASQTMFEQNEGAGSHLSGGLGSAAMAAAGQQHLNNINSYNGQLGRLAARHCIGTAKPRLHGSRVWFPGRPERNGRFGERPIG